MTIKAALIASLDEVNIASETLDKLLLDNGLVGESIYDPELHQKLVDLTLIAAYKKVIARANISEGDYSISYNVAGLKIAIGELYSKWDMVDPDVPTVTGISPW